MRFYTPDWPCDDFKTDSRAPMSSHRAAVTALLYLRQVFEAAAHQRVGTAVGRHLHGVLDESEQLHRQLVDVQDVAEDHFHVLHSHTEQGRHGSVGQGTVFCVCVYVRSFFPLQD